MGNMHVSNATDTSPGVRNILWHIYNNIGNKWWSNDGILNPVPACFLLLRFSFVKVHD